MEKIEFIEVNGSELPLSFFPAEIKQLVSTFEIVRTEYNRAAVNTQALSEYMQRLSQQVQGLADQHVQGALNANPVAAPQSNVTIVPRDAEVVHHDEDEPAVVDGEAE